MKKRYRALSLLLACALAFLLAACHQGTSPSEAPQQRSLCIVWPTLSMDFYSTMAGVMKEQAEAVEDVCVRLRRQGINISFFALVPDNPEAYDSVTVADQYKIGEAIAQNASDWVDATFPDAEDGSIDAVLIEVPADAENAKRAQGMETIRQNAKINVVYTCKLSSENPAEVQGAVDQMMAEYPGAKVILCHFSSLALAADDAAAGYGRIDRARFGIFSGDWDAELAARIQASTDNESLIRGTGTYATDAMEIQFHVCTGEYDHVLNDQKQYVYPVVRITPKNIKDYLG